MYPGTDIGRQGATVCYEYYDARTKAFWRALADESERDEELVVEPIVLQSIEPVKTRPKALVR